MRYAKWIFGTQCIGTEVIRCYLCAGSANRTGDDQGSLVRSSIAKVNNIIYIVLKFKLSTHIIDFFVDSS